MGPRLNNAGSAHACYACQAIVPMRLLQYQQLRGGRPTMTSSRDRNRMTKAAHDSFDAQTTQLSCIPRSANPAARQELWHLIGRFHPKS